MPLIKLHLPIFDQGQVLPGYTRLLLTDLMRSKIAQRDWYANDGTGRLFDLYLTTFSNPIVVDEQTTIHDLVESDYPGSDRIDVADWNLTDPILPPDSVLVARGLETLRVSGPWPADQIHGAMILDRVSFGLLAVGNLDSPIHLVKSLLIYFQLIVT